MREQLSNQEMSQIESVIKDKQLAGREAVSSKPVKVLIVGPSLDILGGQAVQAARLLESFGIEPDLNVSFLPINPRLPGPLANLQKIKYVRTVVTSVKYLIDLLLRVGQYDVIHIFSASYFSFVLAPTPAVLISKLYGSKTILNYHSGEAEDHLQRWTRTAPATIRLFDQIIVPSGYLVDVFSKFGFKADSIFNIIDTTQFRFRKRDSLRPVFLSNRNLESHYNVACLLKAFAIIQQRSPEACLTVAGDGSQRAELERLASDLKLRNVKFIGRVPQEKMPELYDAADIYLNTSNIDNMPNSIIEAYAAGLPVVTTNAGGIPYILKHEETGLMVQREDHEAVAACAIRILEDQSLARVLIENGRAECEKYSWDAVREEWLKAYKELAGD